MNNLLEKNAAGVVQPTKFDGAKVKLNLYPVRAYVETCKVFHYGSIVYSEGNWKEGDGFSWSRLANSAQRHLEDFKLGINYDWESALAVLGHAACCNAMLLEHFLTNTGVDDRARSQIIREDEDLSQLMIMDPQVIANAHTKRARVTQLTEERAKQAGAGPKVPEANILGGDGQRDPLGGK